MGQNKSLASFTDRQLLELLILNQVQFERRLDRIEIYLSKESGKEAEIKGVTNDYWTAPYNQDGRQEGHTFANTFKELFESSRSAKSLINNLMKDEDSDFHI